MPFYTGQGQCTYSVLRHTPHGTNLAGATHTQNRQGQSRGGREMVISTQYNPFFLMKHTCLYVHAINVTKQARNQGISVLYPLKLI